MVQHPSAQTDRFVHDRLPPREQWPELRYDLPELQALPAQLNVVQWLFDRAFAAVGHRPQQQLGLGKHLAPAAGNGGGHLGGGQTLLEGVGSDDDLHRQPSSEAAPTAPPGITAEPG